MIMFTLKMPYYTFDPYLMKLIGQISIRFDHRSDEFI